MFLGGLGYYDYNSTTDTFTGSYQIKKVEKSGTVTTALDNITVTPMATGDYCETTTQTYVLSNGNFLVYWYSGSSGCSIQDAYFKILSPSGAEVRATQRINSAVSNSNRLIRNVEVEQLSNGNIVFVYATDSSNYSMRRIDQTGLFIDNQDVSITTLAGLSGQTQFNHKVVANKNGQFLIFIDYYSSKYKVLIFNNTSSTFVNSFDIQAGIIGSTSHVDKKQFAKALPDGKFLLCYQIQTGVDSATRAPAFQIVNPNGTVYKAEVKLPAYYSWGSIKNLILVSDGFLLDYFYNDLGNYGPKLGKISYLTKYNFEGEQTQALDPLCIPTTVDSNAYSSYFTDVNGGLGLWINDLPKSGALYYDLTFYRQNFGPAVTFTGIENLMSNSAKFNATIGDPGDLSLVEKGFILTENLIDPLPLLNKTLAFKLVHNTIGIGDFSLNANALASNNSYAIRAYAKTSDDQEFYSNVQIFSTNLAPQITSGDGLATATLSTPENTPFSTTIQATDADVPAQTLTFSITGGADASKFTINSATGVLSLVATPDFENPTDTDANNSYLVEINVSDNGNYVKSTTQSITVTITNEAENPLINNANTSSVGITGAVLNATVVSDGGGGSITNKGFVYSLTSVNSNPMIGDTGVTSVVGQMSSATAMAATLTGLSTNSTYTFRAFAVNTTGTAYTAATSFTTLGLNSGPSISYVTPQNYILNSAITDLTPTSFGSSIPALTYKQVSSFAGTTSGFLDATVATAKMDGPLGMTLDANGDVYFIDSVNHRIRKMTTVDNVTTLTTIAGDGYSFLFFGRLRNNASGSLASFNYPADLALDTANNCLYVTDKENDVIRKVSLVSPYAVTTFAGSGTSSSVDGIGTAATFKKPSGIAIDPTGTYLYVTDRGGNKIRRITISTAQVTTIAGSGTQSTLDNATGTAATFNDPTGIAVDADYIYITDFGGHKIRKISKTSPYPVSTIAGSGTKSSLDGSGTAATFDNPYGMTLDGAGNLLVAEWGNKIRKITPAGVVTTIAGSGTASSLDGNGTAATFNEPANIVINPTTGIAYVSEFTGDRIRKINLGGYTVAPTVLPAGLSFNGSTGIITGTPTVVSGPTEYTVTGYNYYGKSTTTLSITTANLPTVTTDAVSAITATTATGGGNVTTNGGSVLLEKGICWSTSTDPTIFDNKVGESTTATGSYTNAITGLTPSTTYYVRAYATTAIGTAYGTQVSFSTKMQAPIISYTTPNQFVLNTAITPLQVTNTGGAVSGISESIVSTLAGSSYGYVNGIGTEAQFAANCDIAADASGNLYLADRNNRAIRKITPEGLVNTLFTAEPYSSIVGVATDTAGNVYFVDNANNKISKITPNGVTTVIAGSGSVGTNNGNGLAASFANPEGIHIDSSGNIFIGDTGNNCIRKIAINGDVTTIAGSGVAGSAEGVGTNASFNQPTKIVSDAVGNLYVVDTGNHKIRKITPSGEVSTLAGNNVSGFANGTGDSAKFNTPKGIEIDASGNLYVGDFYNNMVRKITPSGVVTTFTGIKNMTGSVNGSITSATFKNPYGIVFDNIGNLCVSDFIGNTIRKISFLGYSISPALPAGLVLNADGSITGTPTVASPPTDYVITATNAVGSSSTTISIAVTGSLSVNNQESFAAEVVAYPNPFSDSFSIDVATNSGDAITVDIYGMSGKKIETHKGTPTEISALHYGNNFTSGVYNVVVTQGTEVKTLRMIKK